MPHRGLVLALLVLLVGVVGVPVTGLAHTASSVRPVPVSAPEPVPVDHRAEIRWSANGALSISAALAGTGLALGLTLMLLGHRGRRLAVPALVLVLTLIAFEGAIHSVHHVDDPVGAEHCRVAAVAERVSANGAEQPVSVVFTPPPLGPAPAEPPARVGRASFAAAAGRSPPA